MEYLIEAIVKAHKEGKKVLICGNGGLAAESEHFSAEMVGKFAFDVYVPCFALTTNSSLVTALGNDIGYENVFSHQVKVLGCKGDVLIGMTTSTSKNILKALQVGKEMGLNTFCLCGYGCEPLDRFCHSIRARDKTNTQTIQECILHSLHEIAYEVKKKINDNIQDTLTP